MSKSLDKQSIQFLPQIMPAFLHVLSTCEPGFREFLLQQLGRLVGVVKQHIRDYLDGIFALVKKHWEEALIVPIITLVEEISVALSDEFKVYLPDLIPSLLLILHSDRTDHRRHVQKVLHALEVFNTTVDDYLHLIVPAVVRRLNRWMCQWRCGLWLSRRSGVCATSSTFETTPRASSIRSRVCCARRTSSRYTQTP